ncbi:MAG: hypothetical protein ACYC8V_04400 [Caulobacteraceae bacterium]
MSTAFPPLAAAFEGLAVMRREPKAVAGWIGVWLLALIALGVIQLATIGLAAPSRAPVGGLLALMERFGPLWPVIVPTLLALWIMTTATVFRAVMRPEEHGWHLFKLGSDEGRLAVITAAGFTLVVIFGSGPALILFVLVKPVLAVIPALGRWTVIGGTLATLALETWIAVRLSLTAVHTFAEGRFHLIGYWRLTERCFWPLLASYLVVFAQVVVFLLLVGLAAVAFGSATVSLVSLHRLDLGARVLALVLALCIGLLTALLFVVPSTILSACQARAYKAITEAAAPPLKPGRSAGRKPARAKP